MVRLFMSASKQLESSEIAGSRDDDITFQFFFLDGMREMGKIITWGWQRSDCMAYLLIEAFCFVRSSN